MPIHVIIRTSGLKIAILLLCYSAITPRITRIGEFCRRRNLRYIQNPRNMYLAKTSGSHQKGCLSVKTTLTLRLLPWEGKRDIQPRPPIPHTCITALRVWYHEIKTLGF